MKKTLIALLALAGVASADYTWTGGSTIDSDGWKDADNWSLSNGSEWKPNQFDGQGNPTATPTNGPGTTSSNMWDNIHVSGATGTVGNEDNFTMEGWSLDLYLTNGADLTFQRLMKFQGGANINIDETSSLTFYSYYGGSDGASINLNNKGSFTLGYSLRTQGGDGFVMNLYDTGIVNLHAQNTNSANYAKVSSITAQLTGTDSGIQERTLISITGTQMFFDNTDTTYSFTDANGVAMNAVDSMEALAAATTSSYFVTKDSSGIKVSYNIVPEPTTATLSLLALAGLAARRRRR